MTATTASQTPEYKVVINYQTIGRETRNITLEVPGDDQQDALTRAETKLLSDKRRKIFKIISGKATPLPLTTIIADGLDKSVDGPGWDATHQRAMNLANAAPAMRAFLERIARLVKDGECQDCLLDGDSQNEDCDDHDAFDMPNDDAVDTLHSLITEARELTDSFPINTIALAANNPSLSARTNQPLLVQCTKIAQRTTNARAPKISNPLINQQTKLCNRKER